MTQMLHADHVDTSGAYAQRFEVIKELAEKGVLTDIPAEFAARTMQSVTQQVIAQTPVEQVNINTGGNREHADHVDETGQYMRDWEAKHGIGSATQNGQSNNENSSWKTFLQQIISEEKSKLNI